MDRRNILIGGGALVLAGAGAAYASIQQMGSMEAFNASVAATRARLAEVPEMRDLIRYATLGANSHNTQPWRFKVADGSIQILADVKRRIPVVDPDDHHLFASLGCAAENLAIAAGARTRSGEVTFRAADGVMRHELLGDLGGERGIETATDIDGGEFRMFAAIIGNQVRTCQDKISLLRIGLRIHGHVFASRHRHGTGREAGNARHQHSTWGSIGGRDPDDEAGCRQQPIVGAEYCGAQPSYATRAVRFGG